MPYIDLNMDKMKWSYTFTLGLEGLRVPQLRTDVLKPSLDAFQKNATRLKWMMLAPAFVGDLANRVQRYTDIAEFEVTGKISSGRAAPDDRGKEIFERMRELLAGDTQSITAQTTTDASAAAMVRDAIETGGAPVIMLTSAAPSSQGWDTMLMSYLTAMWTVFETLASDVWEAAVNSNPDRLAQLKGKANRMKKGRSSAPSAQEAYDDTPGKHVKLEFLQFYRWDLTNRMGTVHRNRFDFARLDGIREAYASAFAKKFTDIDKALSDDAIDILSTLRNAIVHKGGVVDKEYLQRRKYLAGLPEAAEGDPIPLDGQIVSHAIGETLFCCASLVGAVDEWLAIN
jgi:hypothetical protein